MLVTASPGVVDQAAAAAPPPFVACQLCGTVLCRRCVRRGHCGFVPAPWKLIPGDPA